MAIAFSQKDTEVFTNKLKQQQEEDIQEAWKAFDEVRSKRKYVDIDRELFKQAQELTTNQPILDKNKLDKAIEQIQELEEYCHDRKKQKTSNQDDDDDGYSYVQTFSNDDLGSSDSDGIDWYEFNDEVNQDEKHIN